MYELRDRYADIRNFIFQCPFLENFNVTLCKEIAPASSNPGEIIAELSYGSSSDVVVGRKIHGEVSIKRHDIYRIKLLQNAANESDRANLYGFIDNFQRWVEDAHFYKLTEAITACEDALVWADSFREESKTSDLYWHIIQLHIIDVQCYARK